MVIKINNLNKENIEKEQKKFNDLLEKLEAKGIITKAEKEQIKNEK